MVINNKKQPYPLDIRQVQAAKHGVTLNNICCMCLKKIKVQIMKNTSVCSERCRKDRDNDHLPFRGGALSP